MDYNRYRHMWVLTMFDLPVTTKPARKRYTAFRKFLLKSGFRKLQYSVYLRYAPSRENAEVHIRRVEQNVPPDGEVRILAVTEKQLRSMRIFRGKTRVSSERPPEQLELF